MVGPRAPSARRQMAPDGEERRRPGGHAAILRDLDRMDRWAGRDLVHLSEVKGKGCCAGDERRHRLPREVVELHPWRCSTASGHPHSHMLMLPAAPLLEELPVFELIRHTGDIPPSSSSPPLPTAQPVSFHGSTTAQQAVPPHLI